ncbi:DNA replication/repair protein RecF [Thermotalea metallivorans]|uniref:DNA replication and repair protein RecF n=1 Tax=Thermotalea metallivorans TaxID=520762 RepID=A0A140KZW4_9FIRM|nr:DNA replication/repair protein RecF [Thermotalea metallivorans]KXG73839.1 DNA replication and repair protein RecF [Thermotalea metallivorans]
MYLKKLKLINFRNYQQLDLIFHPKINVFIGDNAQGKTNILEAIYLTSTGKSFRTNRDRELIKMDKDKAYILVEGEKRYTSVSVELKLEENKKKQIKVNGITLTKNTDLLNNIHVVVFSPEDLKLVKEGPVERRRFMDMEISNIRPRYCHCLGQYNHVLMQRNNLLKKIHHDRKYIATLDVWDEKLVELGTILILERLKFIHRLNTLSRLLHRKITDSKENLEIKYIASVKDIAEEERISQSFHRELKKMLEVDICRGTTTIGPHRDDLVFYVNGIDIRVFGSQGQQRTSALSLKLAEIELVKAETGEYPVLLLDDVMSELDMKRQMFLIKSLRDIQTFITTTDMSLLDSIRLGEENIFYIEKASVKKKNENIS